MAGSVPDEDESILDRADQLKRPRDEALRQQRVLAWHPYLDPNWVIVTLFLMGLCFIPTGAAIHLTTPFPCSVCTCLYDHSYMLQFALSRRGPIQDFICVINQKTLFSSN